MLYGKEELGPRVMTVETSENYRIIVKFNNGERKLFDMNQLLDMPAYQKLPEVFTLARVEFGTVVWPGNIDVSPDTLYLQGTSIEGSE